MKLLSFLVGMMLSFLVCSDELSEYVKIDAHINSVCNKHCVSTSQLMTTVDRLENQYRIHPAMLLAIIYTESRFNARAKNTTHGLSVGLAQIQVRWHRDKLNGRDPYNVDVNLEVASMIYSQCLLKHKGSVLKALSCYSGYQSNYAKLVYARYKEYRSYFL